MAWLVWATARILSIPSLLLLIEAGLGYGSGFGIGNGYGYADAGLSATSIEGTPTSGGSLPVTSFSAIAPSGLSIASENVYEGFLSVVGELPFLGVVVLEGVVPSAGAGVVSYSCGNEVTAITSDADYSADTYGVGPVGIGSGAVGYSSGIAAVAPTAGLGLATRGYGCGVY